MVGCGRKIGDFLCCTVVCGNCLEAMKALPDDCVELVFADPPFNAGKDYGSTVNDNKPRPEYLAWLSLFIREVPRLLRHGGTFWLMHETKWIGYCQVVSDSTGMSFRNMVVWAYSNPTPSRNRFQKTWRPILLYSNGEPAVFDSNAMPLSRSTLYFNKSLASSEFCHDLWVDVPKLVGGIFAQDELITGTDRRFAHLAQMPEKLAERAIATSTDRDATILDPFLGSGTTAIAAKKLGRHFLGFEINHDYCKIAEERIALVEAQPNLFDKKPEQIVIPTISSPTT